AGTDLAGWSLVLYNGAGGAVYDTEPLSGTIPDQQNGFGTASFSIAGIQNGSPDGIALVNGTDVVQFLSYEGTFTAVGGPANGMLSTDIGVFQSGSEPVGSSLQLTGNGTSYADFTWTTTTSNTFGAINTGQSFGTVLNQPVSINCPTTIRTLQGVADATTVTATDPDGTVTTLAITAIAPSDPATITLESVTPAAAAGGTASAELTVGAGTPVGSYTVTVMAGNDDAEPQTATCDVTVIVDEVITIGEVQGSVADTDDGTAHRSPFAPPSGNNTGQTVVTRGVITQHYLQRNSNGSNSRGFFLQSTDATSDGDPNSSDGIFVFHGSFATLRIDGGGFYAPQIGDEVILRGPASEFFNVTQLSNPFLLDVVRSDVPLTGADAEIEWTVADPDDDLAEANRFWERHEGMQFIVEAGAKVTAGRSVFPNTADGEVWVMRGDHPVAQRAEPYADRVFRDPHPLDDQPDQAFDNGNGYRIMLASHGLKAVADDDGVVIGPARTFDTITNELRGGLYFTFDKYAIEVTEQPAYVHGADPSLNAPPAMPDREVEYSTAVYNVENLYDFRDDPFDGCDFAGNPGCEGVRPPFDYVPDSEAAYQQQLANLAEQVASDLHGPDILLIQEAEDQDICTVDSGSFLCGDVDDADGKPDTLQELAVTIEATYGIPYDAAYDRDGADDRGIVNGFLYRTDRVELLAADAGHPVLGSDPQVVYEGGALAYNADVQNPKALNAELPAGTPGPIDGCDVPGVDCVFTRDALVGYFRVWRDGMGTSVFTDLYAISNHFSSGPDNRVGQRTEQARFNAAIVEALGMAEDGERVVVGGDFNVFPQPDDPFTPDQGLSDQLAALYDIGLHDLWAVVAAQAPANAYSYTFEGQAQTLDNQFTSDRLYADLNGVRFAHINADFAAEYDGDGSRGSSDHDPQAARFDTSVTLDRLRDLVAYYVAAGMIDESKVDLLYDRLDRAERFYARGQDDAGDAQLVAFGDQAQDLVPRWVDPAAADALQQEALLLADGT
ncbi:MAG TPA: hypothetical protein VHQ42_05190, partial [Candidatus Limnocylindria bacterium]|nr:hypothetical protein [Candidatus Limnocylindria bacterium]